MKTVEIEMFYPNGGWLPNGTWVLIDTMEDLLDHLSLCESSTIKELLKLFKSDLPVEKWDHYKPSMEAGALSMSVALSKIEGTNPIYSIDRCLSEISKNKINSFIKHGAIFINKMGGYFPFQEKSVRIISEKPFIKEDILSKFYRVPDNTKNLNLENDPELEPYTVKNLSKLEGDHFSYVTCLRDFSNEKLLKIMKKFVKNGGDTLWVYTTGSDTLQMHVYMDLSLEAGINNFVFKFNSGNNDKLTKLLHKYDKHPDVKSISCEYISGVVK